MAFAFAIGTGHVLILQSRIRLVFIGFRRRSFRSLSLELFCIVVVVVVVVVGFSLLLKQQSMII
jgi:hypothetical protein